MQVMYIYLPHISSHHSATTSITYIRIHKEPNTSYYMSISKGNPLGTNPYTVEQHTHFPFSNNFSNTFNNQKIVLCHFPLTVQNALLKVPIYADNTATTVTVCETKNLLKNTKENSI